MTLPLPKTIFGVHSLTLYDRLSLLPLGIVKIIGSISQNFTGDFIDLNGGSNRYVWDSEGGNIDVSIEGTVKEVPNLLFSTMLGASVAENAAETSGNVGTLTNQLNTSVVDAATGIVSAAAIGGSLADLKDVLYVIKAVSATTVDVYAMSDVDFVNGTPIVYQDGLLKITSAPLTVPNAGTVAIPNTGIELLGSAAVAMTIGDTAYVLSRKINSGSDIITIGGSNQVFPEFGLMIASQRKSDGSTFRTRFYRCKGIGLPLNMSEKEWIETDITIKALYDCNKDAIGETIRVTGVGSDC